MCPNFEKVSLFYLYLILPSFCILFSVTHKLSSWVHAYFLMALAIICLQYIMSKMMIHNNSVVFISFVLESKARKIIQKKVREKMWREDDPIYISNVKVHWNVIGTSPLPRKIPTLVYNFCDISFFYFKTSVRTCIFCSKSTFNKHYVALEKNKNILCLMLAPNFFFLTTLIVFFDISIYYTHFLLLLMIKLENSKISQSSSRSAYLQNNFW